MECPSHASVRGGSTGGFGALGAGGARCGTFVDGLDQSIGRGGVGRRVAEGHRQGVGDRLEQCRRRDDPAIEKHDDGTAHAIDGEFVHAGRARVVEAEGDDHRSVAGIGSPGGEDLLAGDGGIGSDPGVESADLEVGSLPAVALAVGGGPDLDRRADLDRMTAPDEQAEDGKGGACEQ